MDVHQLLADMKNSGLRMTTARKRIIGIFLQSKTPITVLTLLANIHINKTTAYREIETLLKYKYITEVDFGEGNKRYELTSSGHHHHLVCTRCKTITDVTLTDDFSKEEKRIASEKNFVVQKHTVEFFGICQRCNQL